MKQKPPARRRVSVPNSTLTSKAPTRTERSDDDLCFFAQAVHKAAKKLAGTLQLGSNPLGEFDAYPVLFMYRHAVELYLKAMVLGEGGNFLGTRKPDHLSVSKTRSVSWLAQFVVQIVTALKWESQFRCEGVEDLAGFKKIIEEVNAIHLGYGMFRVAEVPATTIPNLVRRLDALLVLLGSAADALAAEWDLRLEEAAPDADGNDDIGFKPTIQ